MEVMNIETVDMMATSVLGISEYEVDTTEEGAQRGNGRPPCSWGNLWGGEE